MAWQPMSKEEAQRVLEETPPSGTMDAERFARYTEAWLVATDTAPERVKRAVEAILGRPVDPA